MNPIEFEREKRYLKKVFRIIGGYALLAILLTVISIVTAPNGPDQEWHAILTIWASMLIAFPFVLGLFLWIFFEWKKEKYFRRIGN